MIFIAVSLILFIFTVLVHILFHLLLTGKGRVTIRIFSVFLFGFIINAFLILFLLHNRNWRVYPLSMDLQTSHPWGARSGHLRGVQRSVSLPATSVVLYGLLSCSYVFFFASPFLGDESPSSKILLIVKKSGRMSFEEIKDCFSDDKLILKRLKEMKKAGLIEEKGKKEKRYRMLPKGQKIIKLVTFYRRLINYNLIG